MLIVKCNKERLEYAIHSLVKAFYPHEQVRVCEPGSTGADALNATDADGAENDMQMTIDFLEGDIVRIIMPSGRQYENAVARDDKDRFQQILYLALSKELDRKLPWGDLIGIRPTKIAMTMLEQGASEQEVKEHFISRHFACEEKAMLAIDIAKREKGLLERLHCQDGYSLYIGIPFCPTTCLYCSFTSYPIRTFQKQVETYIDCVIREMRVTAELLRGKILDTVYIGGGTPTTLEADQLDRLITNLKQIFDFSTVQEFTVEAGRADSITEEKLRTLHRHGVTRISVNPQTMHDETLRLIGRRHTVQQVKDAFALARRVGFDNINMDIILGLPGEDESAVRQTVRRIEMLGPESLTVHSLAVKRASALRRYVEENGISMLCNTDATMEAAAQGARNMQMEPYYLYRQKNMAGNFENVGYAREGKYGLYNILIMEEKQTIVALGAGSISKRVYPDGRIERCENVKEVAQYMERIEEMTRRKRQLLAH